MKYLLGLVGHPVSHSLSPPMHRAALEFFGLEGSYDLIDIAPEDLHRRIPQLLEQGYTGFNVTIPHKDAMFRLAHVHTPEATSAQAANTIKLIDNSFMGIQAGPKYRLQAHNTDIEGFKTALTSRFILQRPGEVHAAVLGAGGASRAALVALDALKIGKVSVIARDQQKAQSVLDTLNLDASRTGLLPLTASLVEQFDLVVNTTPLGQQNRDLPSWVNLILKEANGGERNFYDMVYSRTDQPTPLVELAVNRGWQAADGKDMLVHQARYAFEFWTGNLPPFEVMNEAFLSKLK